MKTLAVAACLLFTTSLIQAQTAVAPSATDPKAPVAKAPASKTPVAPTKAVPAKKTEKKPEELPVIPGTVITRPNGNLLGLEVVGGVFKLTFYDKKHKTMAIDVSRAIARWPNPRSPGDNRTVLNGSGNSLLGQKPVVPPFTFNVFLTLLNGDGDEAKAVENYTVPFKG
jgi:hypothetical protein